MEEKARLLRQKNELTNLMKTVENNIEPKRFKTAVGKSAAPADGLDELHDFDSSWSTKWNWYGIIYFEVPIKASSIRHS